jgi:hypothetical protein
MSKIRLNTELRNKMFNKIKNVFEMKTHKRKRHTYKRERMLIVEYIRAFALAKGIVERAYPEEDVKILRHFKNKYGSPCDVVAKDKCFYFAHTEVNDENEDEETKSHFDFGLYGNLNGSEYSSDDGRKFAYAYYRDELKQNGLNADILAEQEGKQDNPFKTKHQETNDKFLGYRGNGYYSDDSSGLCKSFSDQYQLDVIGTSHCRSRTIACTKDEYKQLEQWRVAKGNLVSTHQTWIDSIQKQCEQLKIGLKAYRYLSEAVELATELGIQVDEAELIRTNSTGLTIYNPSNLASMIKGMKNKHQSREAKILARKQYEESLN